MSRYATYFARCDRCTVEGEVDKKMSYRDLPNGWETPGAGEVDLCPACAASYHAWLAVGKIDPEGR